MTIIAVIGHGRSPEGKRWAANIDDCDQVVRMWNWDWQPEAGYGRKYDHGLFTITPKGIAMWERYNARQPTGMWLGYVSKPATIPDAMRNCYIIYTDTWVAEAMNMGGVGLSGVLTLTRGTVAAAWAISCTQIRGRLDVVLVGFDNVKAENNRPPDESFCPEYWRMYRRFTPDIEKVYPWEQPQTATHDMRVEKKFLQQLAQKCGVGLHFAEDVWC